MKRFEGIFSNREVWVVGDGPSCPRVVPGDIPVIAVNHGYQNVSGSVFGLVFCDVYFSKNFHGDLSKCAEWIFSYQPAVTKLDNGVIFRKTFNRQARLRDGVYVGKGKASSAGVAALSLALGMGGNPLRLFGFDYRVYDEEESMQLFGRAVGVHASEANHRSDDPKRKNGKNHKIYAGKVGSFDAFECDADRIVNHAVHSNLHQFKRIPFKE